MKIDAQGFSRQETVSAIKVIPDPRRRNEYVGVRAVGVIEGISAATRWPRDKPVRPGVDVFVRWPDGSGNWQPIENLQRVAV